jgi:transcription elongation factor GreB
MSRAFVKEGDGDPDAGVPERALSPHPNLVTARGLAALRQQLQRALDQRALLLAQAPSDELRACEREIRWLEQRISSAILTGPPADTTRVAIGAIVTVSFDDGRSTRYRIVGEDEAEPGSGCVSWVSPLASALMGARVGDIVSWSRPVGDLEIEIVAIDYEGAGT